MRERSAQRPVRVLGWDQDLSDPYRFRRNPRGVDSWNPMRRKRRKEPFEKEFLGRTIGIFRLVTFTYQLTRAHAASHRKKAARQNLRIRPRSNITSKSAQIYQVISTSVTTIIYFGNRNIAKSIRNLTQIYCLNILAKESYRTIVRITSTFLQQESVQIQAEENKVLEGFSYHTESLVRCIKCQELVTTASAAAHRCSVVVERTQTILYARVG